MIEGARLLPWFHEASRREPEAMAALNDCTMCMRTRSKLARQSIGCGYEPSAPDGIYVQTWKPDGFKGDDPKWCAAYTCALPEVMEVARAHTHWEKGQLRDHVDDVPTDALKFGVELIDSSINALGRAVMMPKSKGGLAEG